MAGLINLRLLTDFFNKIGPSRRDRGRGPSLLHALVKYYGRAQHALPTTA
jgi:hypothetical protein